MAKKVDKFSNNLILTFFRINTEFGISPVKTPVWQSRAN